MRSVLFVQLLKKIFPARFSVARATHVPIIGRFFDHWLFEGDDVMFLPGDGVVRTIEVNQALDMPEEIVLPSQVVEHFIEQASVHWVMNFCLCREAEGCQDYPTDLGCLFLGEAALGINPQLGHRVTKEEALEHLRRCREAGLVHFIGRHKLDTVWLGIGPGTKLLTICNCCPCCCLWKMLPDLDPAISRKVSRMPGVEIWVNELCTGCEICLDDICFAQAISMVGDQAMIDAGSCRGCGRCVESCPCEAIEISYQYEASVNQTIEGLSPLFDL